MCKYGSLMIQKVEHGGYLVTAVPAQNGFEFSILFASTTVEEALKFIKKRINEAPSI